MFIKATYKKHNAIPFLKKEYILHKCIENNLKMYTIILTVGYTGDKELWMTLSSLSS